MQGDLAKTQAQFDNEEHLEHTYIDTEHLLNFNK